MTKNTFRMLVVASLLVFVGVIISYLVQGPFLPEPLRAFHEADDLEMTPTLWAVIFVAIAAMILHLIGAVGLLFFWRPGRVLYLIGLVTGVFVEFFAGATVFSGFTTALGSIDRVLNGLILGLLYYSPLKEHFDEHGEPGAP